MKSKIQAAIGAVKSKLLSHRRHSIPRLRRRSSAQPRTLMLDLGSAESLDYIPHSSAYEDESSTEVSGIGRLRRFSITSCTSAIIETDDELKADKKQSPRSVSCDSTGSTIWHDDSDFTRQTESSLETYKLSMHRSREELHTASTLKMNTVYRLETGLTQVMKRSSHHLADLVS